MPRVCEGCGVKLQNEDKQKIGYTPKMEAPLCQRCFRIRHYDDVMISMKQGIDSDEVLSKIAMIDALVVWVVDLFDFEANMMKGMNRHLAGKDIIMVATKRDLLPITLSDQKLGNFILQRLKELSIVVQGIVITGDLVKHPQREVNNSIDEILYAIEHYRNGKDVVVMGMANAGKSTLLNALCNKQTLTTSRYPGTTLDINKIEMDGYVLYDTPGITRMDSLLTHVDDHLLKTIVPEKALKPRVYQLYENQTISVGGLVRLDLIGGSKVSCVAYFAQGLKLHRSKQEKADQLWKTHIGDHLLSPAMSKNVNDLCKYSFNMSHEKIDIVIHGLGWFCISGDVKTLEVYVPKEANVTMRKAMI